MRMHPNPPAAPRGGLRGVLDALAATPQAVLGVLVARAGPSYRKPGALLLLDGDGVRAGALSGGCLDAELEDAARGVLARAHAVFVAVDTGSADDLLFGSGSGCGGAVRIALLPLPADAPLRVALRALTDSATALQLTLAEDGAGTAILGAARWSWDAAGHAMHADVQTSMPALPIHPPARALLLGAGPETPALLSMLHVLGWWVEVQEHRGRWAPRAADADRLHAQPPGSLPPLATPPLAALVMTHHFEHDRAHLAALAASAIPHYGVIGPAVRRDALLDALPHDLRERLAPRLTGPVGPRLGDGPEAIALALAGALQQWRMAHEAVHD
ncbi:MAG: XdhC family protein [Xanthomonadaceae bacterium]|nr:XdhC family protein [Xanthomonadaceae bacterium]